MKNIFNILLGSGWLLAAKIVFYLYLLIPLSGIKSAWLYTNESDKSGLLGVFGLNILYMVVLVLFLLPASIMWVTTLKISLILKIVAVVLISCAIPITLLIFSLGLGSKVGVIIYYALYGAAAGLYVYMLYKFQSNQ